MTVTRPSSSRTRSRLGVRVRVGQSLLTALLAMSAVIGTSTLFDTDPFPGAAPVLIASFAMLAAVVGIAAVWGGIRSRAVRLSLWALPLFFVWHVAALGTWVPDAAFAVVAAVGAALVAQASGGRDSADNDMSR